MSCTLPWSSVSGYNTVMGRQVSCVPTVETDHGGHSRSVERVESDCKRCLMVRRQSFPEMVLAGRISETATLFFLAKLSMASLETAEGVPLSSPGSRIQCAWSVLSSSREGKQQYHLEVAHGLARDASVCSEYRHNPSKTAAAHGRPCCGWIGACRTSAGYWANSAYWT